MVEAAVLELTNKKSSTKNEAPLHFVSLRSALHCLWFERPLKGRDERPAGALDRSLEPIRACVRLSALDKADDFIDISKMPGATSQKTLKFHRLRS